MSLPSAVRRQRSPSLLHLAVLWRVRTAEISLRRSQAATCDQDHDYTAEQQAFDAGLLDKFPQFAGAGGQAVRTMALARIWSWAISTATPSPRFGIYAQHFAMSDNSFGTTFGPSTPGHINLISDQTNGIAPTDLSGDSVQGR
jgi:phospholipase C